MKKKMQTKQKKKKNELLQESNPVHPVYWDHSIHYVRICPICKTNISLKVFPVELPPARAVPETFSRLDEIAGYFLYC